MTPCVSRPRSLLQLTTVAASVLLFACGELPEGAGSGGGRGDVRADFDGVPWTATGTESQYLLDEAVHFLGTREDGSWHISLFVDGGVTPGTYESSPASSVSVTIARPANPDAGRHVPDGYAGLGTIVIESFDFETEQVIATFAVEAPEDRPDDAPVQVTNGRVEFGPR